MTSATPQRVSPRLDPVRLAAVSAGVFVLWGAGKCFASFFDGSAATLAERWAVLMRCGIYTLALTLTLRRWRLPFVSVIRVSGHAPSLPRIILLSLGTYAVIIAAGFLGPWPAADPAPSAGFRALHLTTMEGILTLLDICLLAPVMEELFFRRLWLASLLHTSGFEDGDALRLTPAVVMSFLGQAVGFALVHGLNRIGLLSFNGLMLACLLYTTRRLATPVLVHAAVNTTSVVLMVIAR